MGVIGRLDDQVNEIIIKPVGERHGAAEAEAPRPTSQKPEPERERIEDKEKADSSELPVWLL
ncbi:MAG TPA: hypothetical protein VF543_12375 [Pyrinomonadaceae bacterium]